MIAVLVDLQYLPSVEYFGYLRSADRVVFEAHENFVKQTYRNRTHILTANGVGVLTIPVKGGNKKTQIQEIEIDYTQKWVNNHWRAIQSAYGKAPYFEYYGGYFHEIFKEELKYLFQLNTKLLTLCLKLLQWDLPIVLSEKYEKYPEKGVIDARSLVHPKKNSQKNEQYSPESYMQLFGNEFVANMSIIDLLFCEGPNASAIITKSIVER